MEGRSRGEGNGLHSPAALGPGRPQAAPLRSASTRQRETPRGARGVVGAARTTRGGGGGGGERAAENVCAEGDNAPHSYGGSPSFPSPPPPLPHGGTAEQGKAGWGGGGRERSGAARSPPLLSEWYNPQSGERSCEEESKRAKEGGGAHARCLPPRLTGRLETGAETKAPPPQPRSIPTPVITRPPPLPPVSRRLMAAGAASCPGGSWNRRRVGVRERWREGVGGAAAAVVVLVVVVAAVVAAAAAAGFR